MNILIHTYKSPFTGKSVGGAETSLRLIAEELVKKGHEVTYLSRSNREFFYNRSEKYKGIQVIHYPHVKPVKVFGQGVVPGFMLQFVNLLFMHFALKTLKLDNYDIVHAFYEMPFLVKMIKLREKFNYDFNIVMRMAGMYWYDDILENPSHKGVYEKVFNRIDSINYISKGLKHMTEEAVNKVDLDYNPNHTFTGDIGVKLNENLPRWKQGQKDRETFDIVVATRFAYQKRQDILVEAIKEIGTEFDIKLKMIGEGRYKEKITGLIQQYDLEDSIDVLPFLPQMKLWETMINSDLLCHPTEDEGLGKIIIEAMAMGVPVLASSVPPLNHYINDGENGFLVNNNPDAWKEKIKEIIKNRENITEISSLEVQYAHAKYDSKKNINMYEREFASLIGK